MDSLILTTLQGLARHHKVGADLLIDLILTREVLMLQNLTDFNQPGSLEALQRTLEKRDTRVGELCQLLVTKVAEVETQQANAKTVLAELHRLRALLQRKHPDVLTNS